MDYFAATEFQNYALLLGVVLLVFIMLRLTARKQRQSGSTPQSHARDHLAKLKEEHAVKGDMRELMVELQELSRNINAQIDTRFAKLEVSIRSADERIDLLERLLRAADGRPTIDTVVSGDDEAPRLPPAQPQAGLPSHSTGGSTTWPTAAGILSRSPRKLEKRRVKSSSSSRSARVRVLPDRDSSTRRLVESPVGDRKSRWPTAGGAPSM